MSRWKGIVTKWKKKNYDSDSTGYCSSSDIIATSPRPPLTDSQFILRRNSLLRVNSIDSSGPTYISLDTGTCPSVSYSLSSSSTSLNTSASSTGFRSRTSGHESSTLTCGTDDETTLRSLSCNSNKTPTLLSYDYCTSLRTLPRAQKECKKEKIQKNDDRQYVQYETDELSGNYSDDEAEIETLDGKSESESGSRCCYMSPIYNYSPPKHFSPTRSIDVLSYRTTPPPQNYSDYNFNDQIETELGVLFDSLEVDQNEDSLALTENSTLLRRKKLQIRETTTKIYYPHEEQRAHTLDPKRLKKEQKQRKSMLSGTTSLPRPILKKGPTPFVCHIYEEIEGDYLDPMPGDIRPDVPPRPYAQPINVFPPCSTFQPRVNRFPSMRKRKKIPSLHKSNSFATFLRKRLKLSVPQSFNVKTL
ncbi:hypothetical protein WR25_19476 [Diploscapter pachys]|uniref:Uncharacterized protein n=1 Tax=Diploscapter pachys TaxID=2018661 RepID=A0A2A2K0E5_9BILA|nr:hypothetical protein WR25_19476 [Diploscapter pachys]